VVETLQAEGHEVLAIRHRTELPSSCTQVEAPLFDPKALTQVWDGAQAIIHLAGIFTGSEEEFKRTHIEGTRAVNLASRELGAKLVVAGSATVYAPGEFLDANENHPTGPEDAYGWSKLLAEEELHPEACVFRLPSLISKAPCPMRNMLRSLLENAPVPHPENGGAPIEMAPVQDVARAMLLAIENQKARGAYNVSGAERPRFVDIIQSAAAAWGLRPNWQEADQVPPALLKQATQARTLSQKRVQADLGYQPSENWRVVLFGELEK
jgi:UDP-glucose 4-epimerase